MGEKKKKNRFESFFQKVNVTFPENKRSDEDTGTGNYQVCITEKGWIFVSSHRKMRLRDFSIRSSCASKCE